MVFRVRQKLKAQDLAMIAAKYRSLSTISIPNATYSKVTLATVTYNYGGSITTTGSNTLVIAKAGVYALSATVQMEPIGSGGTNLACFCFISSGSSTAIASRHATTDMHRLDGGLPCFSLATDALLTAGDTLSLYIWHNHGSARSTSVTADILPSLSARYVGDG